MCVAYVLVHVYAFNGVHVCWCVFDDVGECGCKCTTQHNASANKLQNYMPMGKR